MIKETLEKLTDKIDLTIDEATSIALKIMNGDLSHVQISALLIALKVKGETPEEIAGFARAMREKSIKIDHELDNLIDVCGTGGDSSGTFNISTAASFVVAGAGIRVAKHGNRSISSKSGSSDVLSELGVNINLSRNNAKEALDKIGITFLFAPLYHPAMKNTAPVRAELGVKTIFNLLGPLTNPANTKKQLIGTYSRKTAELMARAASYLGMEKICFVSTDDRYDEISLTGDSDILEFNSPDLLNTFQLNHLDFGYNKIQLKNIMGNSPKHNSDIINSVLRDKIRNDAYYVTAANAALALCTAGISSDIKECASVAEESIDSGRAYDKLTSLINFSGANA